LHREGRRFESGWLHLDLYIVSSGPDSESLPVACRRDSQMQTGAAVAKLGRGDVIAAVCGEVIKQRSVVRS
jgi:hypothetical protein